MMFLAQVSERTDMVFRGLLVPMGIVIAFAGYRAIQRREFTPVRHAPPVKGAGAVVCGAVVMAIGIGCTLAAGYSFLRR